MLLSMLFSFENVRSGPECRSLFWFVKPTHCQFTQLYFGTPGCQLARNTAHFISVMEAGKEGALVPVCVVNLATCVCIKSEEEGPGEKTLSNI